MSVPVQHKEHDHAHSHEHDHAHSHEHDHSHGNTSCAAAPAALSRGTGCCCDHQREDVPLLKLGKSTHSGDAVLTPIRIMQMDCPTEEALLRKKLGAMAGVSDMEFNLMQRVLTVTHEPQAMDAILAGIRSLGFTPELANEASVTDGSASEPV